MSAGFFFHFSRIELYAITSRKSDTGSPRSRTAHAVVGAAFFRSAHRLFASFESRFLAAALMGFRPVFDAGDLLAGALDALPVGFFSAALFAAQRFLCASAIRLLPAALIVRLFGATVGIPVAGLRPRFGDKEMSPKCSRAEIAVSRLARSDRRMARIFLVSMGLLEANHYNGRVYRLHGQRRDILGILNIVLILNVHFADPYQT